MKKQDDRISTRLTNQQRQDIEEKISNGQYESLSHFLRCAIQKELYA